MTVVALCGGVGGAKLALGLYRVLPPDSLTIIVNTGDDFDHLGLRICPDLDTVLYTLAGIEHPEQGWGRRDETWTMMRTIGTLGEATWFKLGDGDAALHIVRTHRLRNGWSLSDTVREFKTCLGVTADIIPMTESRVETRVDTDEGELTFQEYFVKRRCEPRVSSIRFVGAADAAPTPGILSALASEGLETIVLCPSNPYLSVDPMLSIPGLRGALDRRRVPLVAVSPLIAGQAVKGPTAKIMSELGVDSSPAAIAAHYEGLIDALVIDAADTGAAGGLPIPVFSTATMMRMPEDRVRLAHFVLDCGRKVRPTGTHSA